MYSQPPRRRAPVMVSNFKRTRTNHRKALIDQLRQQLTSGLLDAIQSEFRSGRTEKDVAEMLNTTQRRLQGIVTGSLGLELETLVMYNMCVGNDVRLTLHRSSGPMQL